MLGARLKVLLPMDKHQTGSAYAIRSLYFDRVRKEGIPAKEGLHETLEILKELGIPMGVATSSSRENTLKNLEREKIIDYFETVITGDMIRHGKPEPDIYLEACRQLKAEPRYAIALEDAVNGIKAAARAGMMPVMIPDLIKDTSNCNIISEEEKIDYADTLLEAAKYKQKIRYGLGISSNESFLKYRIYSICENRTVKRSVFVILLTILTVVSSFFVLEPTNREAPEGTFSIRYDNPYMIHDEEGYHIIVDGNEVGLLYEVPDIFKDVKIIENIK